MTQWGDRGPLTPSFLHQIALGTVLYDYEILSQYYFFSKAFNLYSMCVFPISALFRIFYLIYKYFTEAIDNICIIIFVQYLLQLQFNLVENKSLDDGDIWRHQVNWEKWSRLLSLHPMCSSGGWLTAKWEMNRIGNILYLWSGPHRWFLVFCFFWFGFKFVSLGSSHV